MSLSAAGKTQIAADLTAIADGDNIASYLVDASGTLLTSTLVGAKQSLDVLGADTHAESSTHTTGDFGSFSLIQHENTKLLLFLHFLNVIFSS